MPADVQDRDGAEDLFRIAKRAFPRLEHVWADGAYGKGGLPDWAADELGWRVEVVTKRKEQRGFEVQPRRWVVERTFGWLLRNRRLSKDYEELESTTEAWGYAGMTRILLRRLSKAA